MGEFGVGKDTVANYIIDYLPEEYCRKIKSFTTRKPRYDGEDTHIFVEKDETKIPNDSVAAWTKIDDNYYWTTKEQFDTGKMNIYVVDKIGAYDIINSHIDHTFVLEVIRPEWMRNVSSYRLGRETMERNPDDYVVKSDVRLLNTNSKEELKRNVEDLFRVDSDGYYHRLIFEVPK